MLCNFFLIDLQFSAEKLQNVEKESSTNLWKQLLAGHGATSNEWKWAQHGAWSDSYRIGRAARPLLPQRCDISKTEPDSQV